jgi:hypothetical protein
VTPNELDANSDSSGSDNSSALSPSTAFASAGANVRLRIERKRQRELADVVLLCRRWRRWELLRLRLLLHARRCL